MVTDAEARYFNVDSDVSQSAQSCENDTFMSFTLLSRGATINSSFA